MSWRSREEGTQWLEGKREIGEISRCLWNCYNVSADAKTYFLQNQFQIWAMEESKR